MDFSSSLFSSYLQSDFLGKTIFWFLFFLSSLSWTYFIQKIWLTEKIKRDNRRVGKFFLHNASPLLNLSCKEQKKSFFSEIYQAMQSKSKEVLEKNSFFSEEKNQVFLSSSDIDLVDFHLQTILTKKLHSLEKHLFILPTVIALAPFLGLLGTVWGILLTLSELTKHSLSSMNSQMLSGLSMALGTTVAGLIVAIPALIAYNYLKNELSNLKKESQHFAHDLIVKLEMQYRKVEPS